MKVKPIPLFLFTMSFCGSVGAAVCTESIKQVIVHTSGNIYFTTDQTCSSAWCQLVGSNADFVKRGYALLLSAKLSGKRVQFSWPNLGSCAANPVYSSPEYMYIEE